MELDRRRSAWRQRAYRVLSVQRPLHEIVAELNAFDPTILSGYPSALEQLADEQLAGRLHLRPILAEIAGESVAPDAGSRMEAAFGCEIHNAYGASEFPFFAFSCSHGWLHVSSDWAILEPVDEDFRPTPAGTASHTVLLTNLANRIQPIVRYDLGDSVLVKPDPCSRTGCRCGDALAQCRGEPAHLPERAGTLQCRGRADKRSTGTEWQQREVPPSYRCAKGRRFDPGLQAVKPMGSRLRRSPMQPKCWEK